MLAQSADCDGACRPAGAFRLAQDHSRALRTSDAPAARCQRHLGNNLWDFDRPLATKPILFSSQGLLGSTALRSLDPTRPGLGNVSLLVESNRRMTSENYAGPAWLPGQLPAGMSPATAPARQQIRLCVRIERAFQACSGLWRLVGQGSQRPSARPGRRSVCSSRSA